MLLLKPPGLVKLAEKGGEVLGRRLSPKRGQIVDLFDELVHFTRAFPHRRLTLEVPLVEVEERRYPGHGRRRRWNVQERGPRLDVETREQRNRWV